MLLRGYGADRRSGCPSRARKIDPTARYGGSLYAWGNNGGGQLGDGTTTNRSVPTLIGTGYTAIAAGTHHNLALKGGALYAWGANGYRQYGDGTTTQRDAPILVGTGYSAIEAGDAHNLALKGGMHARRPQANESEKWRGPIPRCTPFWPVQRIL
jgi:hypothetical protein